MSTSVTAAKAAGVVAAVARLCAESGSNGIAAALRLVRDRLGLVAVVLHDADGDVVTGVAVPHQRGSGQQVDIPVRAGATVHGWLSVTAATPVRAEAGATLAAVADVLALVLEAADAAATARDVRDDAAQAVLDDEAERATVADVLRDRVGDVLVALGYTAALVADGQAEPTRLAEPVQAALTAFRSAHRDLRAEALDAGLRTALAEVASRREADGLDDGLPSVTVAVEADDPALDRLPPAVAVTVQRVAETSLRGVTGPTRLCASVAESTVKLQVGSADIAYDAGEIGRWERRVRALGGDLWVGPDGVELSLPAASEGSHDDGPDL